MCVFVRRCSVYIGHYDKMIKSLYSPVQLSCVHICTFFFRQFGHYFSGLCLMHDLLISYMCGALQLEMSPRHSAEHESTHRFWVCTKINLFDKSTRMELHEGKSTVHTQLALDTVS